MIPPSLPCQRSIVAVDIEASTAQTNPIQGRRRDVMYELMEKALHEGGIAEDHRDSFVDRGDGILALIHAVDQVPKALLLNPVIPTLSRLLDDHCSRYPDERFRLRAAVHAGDVQYDRNGCFGAALNLTFRLLDSPAVKRKLRDSNAPLVLVVSEEIYRTVVWHGYHGDQESIFEPVVRVRIAGQQHPGWVHIPRRAHYLPAQGIHPN